ncbi:hypothetical protein K3N28_05255 [Glycomyces sp. TRM65418]|uniref:hypothetical protein n=1 Tax=Glycomyces sp. TRM65418 TaxID=2867006 RepID=UPI001CE4C1D0|nr:hypothetical protein [Glycomyces sp. TRM65418]MCC3762475.1 hypothetical protein [Glycomyces sp. TRM65418]QZD56519.1 hypothetical protein K3N28_05215 [Glycomyces sp. TRM65418]
MADHETWVLVEDFAYGIGMGGTIRFLVERSTVDYDLHRVSCDEGLGNGPREVCTFTQPAAGPVQWRRAWDGDAMSPRIERDARAIAQR